MWITTCIRWIKDRDNYIRKTPEYTNPGALRTYTQTEIRENIQIDRHKKESGGCYNREMKIFSSETQKKGYFGEKISSMFLMKHGYTVVERNFTTKEGEIDIIAKKNDVIYFIEVKSVFCKNTLPGFRKEVYNPAENITKSKIQKIKKAIHSYTRKKEYIGKFKIIACLVFIDKSKEKKHKIELLEIN